MAELHRLRAEGAELRAQMAALVGHQNHKQKIQYTMSLKRDNDALKAANVEMGEDAAKSKRLVERLRTELERAQRRAARAADGGSEAGSVAPSVAGTSSEAGTERGGTARTTARTP